MRNSILGLAGLVMVLFAPGVQAQSLSENYSILSAFKDVSNFSYAATRFGFSLFNDTGDDLFVNSISFLPGFGYDTAIGLDSPGIYDSTQPLGSAIAPDSSFQIYNAVERFDAVDPSVLNGIYNFSLEVFGGTSDSSFDFLGSLDYQIRIADGINVSITQAIATPNTIAAGQTTTVNLTVTNDDFTETFVTTTWWYSNGGMMQGDDNLENGQFVGNWYDQSIGPESSRSGDHTTWDASIATALGGYSPSLGIRGGLYFGDEFDLSAPAVPIVTVVPEPASVGLIVISAALLLRRRRGSVV